LHRIKIAIVRPWRVAQWHVDQPRKQVDTLGQSVCGQQASPRSSARLSGDVVFKELINSIGGHAKASPRLNFRGVASRLTHCLCRIDRLLKIFAAARKLPSRDWIKVKNPNSLGMIRAREAE
jgi:hypothetical protein